VVLLIIIDSSENLEQPDSWPLEPNKHRFDDGAVPAAEGMRRLWVR
jgi:hypothetical protein